MIRVIQAEGLKLKKLTFAMPVIVSVIFISMTALEWYLYFRSGPGGIYSAFNVMYLFLSFTVLLEISILSSLIATTEHEALGWKWMCSLPVSRVHFLLAKAFWVIVLLFITALIIVIGVVALWILYTDRPLPVQFLVEQTFSSFLAGLPVLAIQLWLSVQWVNQSFPLSVGILGSISSLFISRSQIEILHFLPWAYPGRVTPFFPDYLNWLGLSIAFGLILLGLGGCFFSRKDQYV